MTGYFIDTLALSLLGTGAIYLLFLNAGFSIAGSAARALLCACLTRAAIDMRPRRYAATRQQAEAALDAILQLPDGAAETALRRLALPGEATFVPLLRYPGDRLAAREIYALWRAHRGEERLFIAATCQAGGEAAGFAVSLTSPAVILADRSALLRAVRRTGLYVPPDASHGLTFRRLRNRLVRLVSRRASPRALLSGLALLSVYLTTGRALCLVLSMLVLFHTGATWIHAATRA